MGTEYYDAFRAGLESVNAAAAAKHLDGRALHVMFMTDGGDASRAGRNVSDMVDQLCRQHSVATYLYILFGFSGTNPSLDAITTKFQQHNVEPQLRTAVKVEELQAAFDTVTLPGSAQ